MLVSRFAAFRSSQKTCSGNMGHDCDQGGCKGTHACCRTLSDVLFFVCVSVWGIVQFLFGCGFASDL